MKFHLYFLKFYFWDQEYPSDWEFEDSDDEIFEDGGAIELEQNDSDNSDVEFEDENEPLFKQVLSTDSEEDRYFDSIAETDNNSCCIRVPRPPSPEVDDSYWDSTPAGRTMLHLGREADEWPIERTGYWMEEDDEKQGEHPEDHDWAARMDWNFN